ncbi:MAG: glycoside hydrolase family 15 protein [Enterobacterales bacterium endosymbiont of Blomia tropicalis]|uniref:glycoside hydrolase family 15 protein n=1 Tax=Mixta mediterraneensis TaxID=2758443 RepID=UPI0025A78A48|nr:glycoside hydrolase family 15 protein [Mixta mediterraneensis]MDL4912509.1 glycoside hydrolase family 15 protein [Mixta mediterraneensis]
MENQTFSTPERENGFAELGSYAAIGEGRSVALIAPDGSIDWWCAPNLDSKPLFDRLLDPQVGGYFQIVPDAPYRVTRQYRENSNVLETQFETESGCVRITESINSTLAGRLPWSELVRRIEGIEGQVKLTFHLRFGTAAETRSPWVADSHQGKVFHIAKVMAMVRTSEDVEIDYLDDEKVTGRLLTSPGSRSLCALLISENEPLAVPELASIDKRIETSDTAWRDWVNSLSYQGSFPELVKRSALSLKFLWYSPTGALAAAATTSLPEGIGGEKNYDYRYAWVRDACLIIKAFVYLGALEDSKAAFSWLSQTIIRHGVNLRACYTLKGDAVPEERYPALAGYMGSQPVRVGNNARDQVQLSMFGDMLATAQLFISAGHVLDLTTSRMLGELANSCADNWRQMDSGIWELPEQYHYTHSKMACWLALDRAVAMAESQHIEPTWVGRWKRERDRIRDWIETHCWSEQKQAYVFYVGSEQLDASLALTHHYGKTVNPDRMLATYQAIRKELGNDSAMLYRYSGAEKEESTFLACSFWLVEAWAALDENDLAQQSMNEILETFNQHGNVDIFNEMFDVRSNSWRGNMPQGLSHLALICAAQEIKQEK